MKQYVIREREAGRYIAAHPTLTEAAAKIVDRHFKLEDWEWFDVSIRCYLLGECLGEYLDTCKNVVMAKVEGVRKHA